MAITLYRLFENQGTKLVSMVILDLGQGRLYIKVKLKTRTYKSNISLINHKGLTKEQKVNKRITNYREKTQAKGNDNYA